MDRWFTDDERTRLLAAGRLGLDDDAIVPQVRLFQPDGAGVWLIGELDPARPDLAYGLADIGVGAPEVGTISLTEVAGLRGALNLAVERDIAFRPAASLAVLARWATAAGRIVR